jgi:hypothetical protein
MKKLIYTFIIWLLVMDSYGQSSMGIWPRNYLNIRVGPELAYPIKQLGYFQNIGTGGSALVDIPVTQRIAAVVSAGYLSFAGDVTPWDQRNRFPRASIIPIRGGAYYRLLPDFYSGVQVGYALISFPAQLPDEKRGGFSQSIGAYYFNGQFDVGASWDHHYTFGGLNSLNLRAAYVLFGRRQ